MKNLIVVLIGLVAVALGLVIASNRPTADQDAVQYRQALMTVIDGTMDPLLRMQQGRMSYNAALAGRHAEDLVVLGSMIPEAFARNTGSARKLQTAALPYVWTDHAEFLKSAQRLQADAGAVRGAVAGGSQAQVDKAIGQLAGECDRCHRGFREN